MVTGPLDRGGGGKSEVMVVVGVNRWVGETPMGKSSAKADRRRDVRLTALTGPSASRSAAMGPSYGGLARRIMG